MLEDEDRDAGRRQHLRGTGFERGSVTSSYTAAKCAAGSRLESLNTRSSDSHDVDAQSAARGRCEAQQRHHLRPIDAEEEVEEERMSGAEDDRVREVEDEKRR